MHTYKSLLRCSVSDSVSQWHFAISLLSVLAGCCRVLHCVVVCRSGVVWYQCYLYCSVLQHVAACCSVMQHIAVCHKARLFMLFNFV